MKSASLLLLGLAFSPLVAAEPPASGQLSAYQQAVNAYVEAAGQELHALKVQIAEVQKTVPENRKRAGERLGEKLRQYEAAYEQLKAAAAGDFDRLKARYEMERGEVQKQLAEVTKA